ncbi:DNA cytosine methyltransferase [Mesorhizobium sp. M0045]|uniref:DNA cytosine methyltransferase n=1 Tax=Mesorhizobium sp. M0045 TaxID=2956857 RepID=UPI003337EBC7
MTRKMLVADLLCGAGGSSTGAQRALHELGLGMELVCVNHWDVAIDTHQRNHREARHYVQDIATVRPHLIVPEGYLDLLMASPTCTHHSVARGGKPTSDQQRSDPWHIITWLTELRVKRIIIENVWEFVGWGPVDHRTGKPIKSRKGEYFHAWIETIKRLGFEPEWRKLNAADYGDATTRQRFILMARSDARKVSWPMPTHGRRNEAKVDLFADTKPWRPAREIIDWKIKGKSIFNRRKSLAPKTLARIYAGAVKFEWPEPFLVILRKHMDGRSLDEPIPALATGGHIGIAEPIVLSQRSSGAARSTKQPLPTIMTGGAAVEERPGCARPMLVEPFVLSAAHGVDTGERDPHSRRVKSLDDPIGAVHAGGGNFGVVEPFVLSRQGGGAPRSVDHPTPAQVAKHSHVLISPYYGSGSGETCSTSEEPLPTLTAKARFGMVVPITHSDGSNRARDVDNDPLATVTGANRGEFAFIAAQFGEREGQAPRVHEIDNPAPTIAATGHINLVEATETYDILFRMLEPHELAAAMGFTTDEATYEFAGTKTEKIKQIGNAVSVAKMKACVAAIMADAAPKRSPVTFREAAE